MWYIGWYIFLKTGQFLSWFKQYKVSNNIWKSSIVGILVACSTKHLSLNVKTLIKVYHSTPNKGAILKTFIILYKIFVIWTINKGYQKSRKKISYFSTTFIYSVLPYYFLLWKNYDTSIDNNFFNNKTRNSLGAFIKFDKIFYWYKFITSLFRHQNIFPSFYTDIQLNCVFHHKRMLLIFN